MPNNTPGDREDVLVRAGNALRRPVRILMAILLIFLLGYFIDDVVMWVTEKEQERAAAQHGEAYETRIVALAQTQANLEAEVEALEAQLALQRQWVPRPVPRPERTTSTATTTDTAWSHIPRRTDCNC